MPGGSYDGPHGMEGEFLDAIESYTTQAEALKVQVAYASDYVGFSESMTMLKTNIDDVDERAEIFVSLQPKYVNVSSVEGYKRLYNSIREELVKFGDVYEFGPYGMEAQVCEQKYRDESMEELYIWISDEIRDGITEAVCDCVGYYRTSDLDNEAMHFVLENLYAISFMDNELLDMISVGIATTCADRAYESGVLTELVDLIENIEADIKGFIGTLLEDIYLSDLDTVKESGLAYLALDD